MESSSSLHSVHPTTHAGIPSHSSGGDPSGLDVRVDALKDVIPPLSSEADDLDGKLTSVGSPSLKDSDKKVSHAAKVLTPHFKVEPVPAAPIKLDEATEIARIEALAKAPPVPETSSQMLLNDIIKTFENLKYTNIRLSSKLEQNEAKNPGEKEPYKVEAYTLNSDPPKTCYRIKVDYQVEAVDSDGKLKEISFSRTISTTATNPADAVLIASQFKKRVEEYATLGTTLEDKSLNISGRDADFNKFAMSSKTFSFSFDRNAAGGLTHLSAIKVMKDDKDKTVLEHKIPSSLPKNTSYGYNFQTKKEIAGSEGSPGDVFFETEEQRSIYQNGVITLNRNYEDLEKDEGALEKEAQLLQDEIKKKQTQFEEIKTTFLKDPFLKFIRKNAEPTLSPEFIQFAEHLSPTINNYVEKKAEIQKIKKEQEEVKKHLALFNQKKPPSSKEYTNLIGLISKEYKISEDQFKGKKTDEILGICKKAVMDKQSALVQLVKDSELELEQLGAKISSQQKPFNQQLGELHKIHEELKFQFHQLNVLYKKAFILANNDFLADEQKKAQAQAFLKLVPKDMIEKLEKRLASQDIAIQTILGHLEKLTKEFFLSQENLEATE